MLNLYLSYSFYTIGASSLMQIGSN